jgi:hypothetical protein
MSTSVVLKPEISASKEAYFSWEITFSQGVSFKKGMLYLTDIDQDSDPDSYIFKYQLHSTESPAGSHIFEALHVGPYYARLTIIGSDNSINVSDFLTVSVYELGEAEIESVTSRDSSFSVILKPYAGPTLQSDQTITTVNFILFGRQKTSTGFGEGSVSLNIVKEYNSDGDYIIGDTENKIENGWQYEIACFYTDNKIISGGLSNTKIGTPTNKPNQITDVSAVYNSLDQQLIINYSNPDDYLDWEALTLKAKIIHGNTIDEYIFDVNSSNFTFDEEQIVFDMNSSPSLPVDVSFNITLNISNTFGYSDDESQPITCIVPYRFCSEPATISNLQYIVGDNEFSVTYDKSSLAQYDVRVHMIVIDTDTNIEKYNNNYYNGDIVDVENGSYYNVNLQVFYTAKFNNSIEFGPCTPEVSYFDYNFIPHGKADAPVFLVTDYGDGSAIISWNTPNFNGYSLDKYQVSDDDGNSWYDNDQYTTKTILCGPNYTSGVEYKFKVKAFTKSPDLVFDDGAEIEEGNTSVSINVYPLEKPELLTVNKHVPGYETSDITFTVNGIKGGTINNFNYIIDNTTPEEMLAYQIDTSSQYSYLFQNLTNTFRHKIHITVVTVSGDNTQESDVSEFFTTPFEMPIVPTLSAKPYTSSVNLSWLPNNPDSIISLPVEYDVEYKVADEINSEWVPATGNYILNTETNKYTLTIDELTSNIEYKFKIRSKIHNQELFEQGLESTLYSSYSTEIISRPFIYKNKPTMNLRVDNKKIIVELTRSTANYYEPYSYHATVALTSNPSVILETIVSTSSETSKTLTFDFNNVELVNLELYTVVAFYNMISPGISDAYKSDDVSNSAVIPFDPAVVPFLSCTPEDSRIKLSWNDGNMNGLTIIKYQVSSKLYEESIWSEFADFNPNISDTEAQNTNSYNAYISQANGQTYDYKIQAVILDAGNEYYSISNTVTVTPFTFATSPILDSYVSSDKAITLNWNEPSNLGGLILLRYEVQKSGDTDWQKLTNTSLSYKFEGLNNGSLYTFYVRAVTNNNINKDNLGYVNDDIISINNLFQPARPYAHPTITLERVVSGDRKLTLYWTQTLGGHIFDHYNITYTGGSISTTLSNLYYEIPSLINGNHYDCQVEIYVKDENDNAPKDENGINLLVSEISTQKTNIPYVQAVAPKNVESVPHDTYVDVSWDDLTTSEELGGLPFERYEVNYKELNATSLYLSIWQHVTSGNLYHKFDNLNNGTEYIFYVRAVTTNEHHTSDSAKPSSEVIGFESLDNNIPYLPLAAPVILNCEPQPKSALLKWSAPELVGLSLDYYEVSGGNLLTPYNVGISTQYLFEDLLNNDPYSFYVKAVTSHKYYGIISGPNSAEVTTIPYERPDKVLNLVCSAVNNVLTINFTSPTTSSVNNGLPQDYKYTLNNGDYNDVYSGESISISSFGSSDITVCVFARILNPNDSDESVYSYENKVVVSNSNLASDIQNLTASPGDKMVTLYWENINSTSGSTYGIVHINDAGEKSLLKSVSFQSGQPLTTTITSLADGSLLVNGKSYIFHVYASVDDVLKISATPIGKPIFNSISISGSNFNTDVSLNGSNTVDITIIAFTTDGGSHVITGTYTTRLNTILGESSASYLSAFIIASNSVGTITTSLITFE